MSDDKRTASEIARAPISASQRCDSCAPEHHCFNGEEPCANAAPSAVALPAHESEESTVVRDLRASIVQLEHRLFVKITECAKLTADLNAARSAIAQPWRPMWELPQVTGRTEMLFRKEWTGRDNGVRAIHEVLWVWPDGVLTDYSETVVAPEEMPTHWMPLPQGPRTDSATTTK